MVGFTKKRAISMKFSMAAQDPTVKAEVFSWPPLFDLVDVFLGVLDDSLISRGFGIHQGPFG